MISTPNIAIGDHHPDKTINNICTETVQSAK